MFNLIFAETTAITILASTLFVIFLVFKYIITQKRFHPGPIGIPFVGYLSFAGKNQHLKLTELQKQYGDVFSFQLGWMHFVVLGSFDAVKEAMTKYVEFEARPKHLDMMPNLEKWKGVAVNYGHSWAQIRRLSISILRDFGFGTGSIEQKIQDEVSLMLQCISQRENEAIYIEDTLRLSTSNTVCAILFGQRFDYNDKTFKTLMKLAYHYTNELRIDQIKAIFPAFLIKLLRIKDAGYYGNQLYDIFLDIIEQRAKSGITSRNDSFIDAWLEEQKKPNIDPDNFNNRQLAKVVWDLFIASSDTTATTVYWILLYLAHYQEVQLKVQKEIDEIIGRYRTPDMNDQKQMPFTEAVTREVNRLVPILPLSLPKRALEDVNFRGFIIPKDATIFSNNWSINHDSSIYPQPEEFKPERFLNKDNKIIKQEELMPFGIGKRQCMGESLGRVGIFLYVTSILQNFSVKPVNNSCIDLIPKFGLLLHPKPQQICIIRR